MGLINRLKKLNENQDATCDIDRREGRSLKNSSLMLALEPRYLYDAAGAVVLVDAVSDGYTQPDSEQAESSVNEPVSDTATAEEGAQDAQAFLNDLSPVIQESETGSDVNQIVFVDPILKDYQTITQVVSPEARIIVLDPGRDGVEQISEVLSQYQDLSAVHIFSHGGEGRIIMSSSELSVDNIDSYSQQLTEWGNSLSGEADILIYGCDVAGSESGEALVSRIAGLTGADVAASDDATGASGLGGDWDLEAQVGTIESDTLAVSNMNTLLGAPVIAGGNNDFEDGLTGWTTTAAGAATLDTKTLTVGGGTEWFVDSNGSGMAVLNPTGAVFNDDFASFLGVSADSKNYISDTFFDNSDRRPTDFAAIKTTFNADAGDTFSISWNYISTDYVPYNDGSVLSVVNTGDPANVAKLNDALVEVQILGATNPGTGNYTTDSYGSTGWQTATVEIQTAGTYTLGLSVFNLGDMVLDPYLFIDDPVGITKKNDVPFDPVPPDDNPPPGAVNSAPVIGTNSPLTVNEGASGTITNTLLNESDPDDSGAGLTYTVTGLPANGTLKNNGTALGNGDTFTQADIDGSKITYTHNDSETTSDSFNFSLADGGENGSDPVNGTFNINVTPVDDAPSPAPDPPSLPPANEEPVPGKKGGDGPPTGFNPGSTNLVTSLNDGNSTHVQQGEAGVTEDQGDGGAPFAIWTKPMNQDAGDLGGSLVVDEGIPDIALSSDGSGEIRIPKDAFSNTEGDQMITYTATMSDGSPLPAWVKFDQASGIFVVNAGKGHAGSLEIRVMAHDSRGDVATTNFRIFVEEDAEGTAPDSGAPVVETSGGDAGEPNGEPRPARELSEADKMDLSSILDQINDRSKEGDVPFGSMALAGSLGVLKPTSKRDGNPLDGDTRSGLASQIMRIANSFEMERFYFLERLG